MPSLVVAGYDLYTINWTLILYVILSLCAVGLGSSRLYPSGMGVASVFAAGSTALFIYFGYRWFSNPTAAEKSWPPSINTCPDYLSIARLSSLPTCGLWASLSTTSLITADTTTGGIVTPGTGGCVDTVGVSTTGSLPKYASGDTPSGTNVFPYTSKDVLAAAGDATKLQNICNVCKTAGVTWEGVYDGDSCVAITVVSNMASKTTCS